MRALIVEDESIAARRLGNLIAELAPEIEIAGSLSSVEHASHWFEENEMPDLIFLDIQLNDGYGFDILDKIEEHPPIVFTTAYNEYAIRGFKYNGLDYLLKPIDKGDLEKALSKFRKLHQVSSGEKRMDQYEKIVSMFGKVYKHRFMVKIGNQYNTFNVKDITFFKSEKGLIYLNTSKGQQYPIEYSLDQLEEILDPVQFFRINRQYIVSVEAVSEIHSYFNSRLLLKLSQKTEDQVIVSRERATSFKKWLDI
ncbi:LytR/AlgR family response regulator transcription factor [Flavobacteriaceae bacterium M23B6Z8]